MFFEKTLNSSLKLTQLVFKVLQNNKNLNYKKNLMKRFLFKQKAQPFD